MEEKQRSELSPEEGSDRISLADENQEDSRETYTPRTPKQLWAARLALLLFILFVIWQVWQIYHGFR